MFARDQGFVAEGSVEVQFLPPLGLRVLGRVTQDQRDFIGHIQPGERVVSSARRARHGESVSSENHFTFELVASRERKRPEVLFDCKSGGRTVRPYAHRQPVLLRDNFRAGSELERLKVTMVVAQWLDAGAVQLVSDE